MGLGWGEREVGEEGGKRRDVYIYTCIYLKKEKGKRIYKRLFLYERGWREFL